MSLIYQDKGKLQFLKFSTKKPCPLIQQNAVLAFICIINLIHKFTITSEPESLYLIDTKMVILITTYTSPYAPWYCKKQRDFGTEIC